MKTIRCNQPVFCDVDDTLIMWNLAPPDHPDSIPITCPYTRNRVVTDKDEPFGEEQESEVQSWTEYVVPNKEQVEQLKRHKVRGHTVIVWSAGGYEWAEVAVKALGLEKYVDVVMEKPHWVYDDLPSHEFMPKSRLIK